MTTMRAFGDSFTNPGTGAATGQGYLSILSRLLGVSIANFGVNGGMVAEMSNSLASVAIQAGDISIVELGTNDHRKYGTDATKLGYFRAAYLDLLAYLSTPAKTFGLIASVTGSWSVTPSFGMGKNTSQSGATMTFTATGPVVYLSMAHCDGWGGAYTVEIDGVVQGTYQTNHPGMLTSQNQSAGNITYRYAGLSAGSHTIKVTCLGTGAIYPEWCGGNAQAAFPKIYAMLINKSTSAGYASSGKALSDTTLQAYQDAIQSVVTDLVQDGADITVVDSNKLYFTDADIYTDGIHPYGSGHCKIALNLYSAMGHAGF